MSKKELLSEASISFAFPNNLKKQIQKAAKREQRPLSSYIRMVLQDHVNNLNNLEVPEVKNTKTTKRRRK